MPCIYFRREVLLLFDSFDFDDPFEELAFLLLPLLREPEVPAFWPDDLEVPALVLFCPDLELDDGAELTVPDDLLFETVFCPAVELLLALLLTVVVERGVAALFPLAEELPRFDRVTVPDDLLVFPDDWRDEGFVAVLPDLVEVDLVTVDEDLFTEVLLFDLLVTVVDDRRDEDDTFPVDCLAPGDCETDLLLLLSPVDITEGLTLLPGLAFTNTASPSLLDSGCEYVVL
jgi:hypothetical protein